MRPLTLQLHGQLCLVLLISHHPRPFFNLEPSFLCEPELKTTLVEIYCGNGCNIRKALQTVVGMIHAQPIRTEKVAFLGIYPVLINYSEDHKIGPVIHREYWLYPER